MICASGVNEYFGEVQLRGKLEVDNGERMKVDVQRTWSQRQSRDKVKGPRR
jgi:hypothetical protein